MASARVGMEEDLDQLLCELLVQLDALVFCEVTKLHDTRVRVQANLLNTIQWIADGMAQPGKIIK